MTPTPDSIHALNCLHRRTLAVTTYCHYTFEQPVIFSWDERKRRANLRKHGIDFEDCALVFAGPTVTVPDDRFEYGEPRFVTFGLLAGRVVAVAHTEPTGTVRVISMRKATKHEQTAYFETIEN